MKDANDIDINPKYLFSLSSSYNTLHVAIVRVRKSITEYLSHTFL